MKRFIELSFWRELPGKTLSFIKKLIHLFFRKIADWHKRFELRVGSLIAWPFYCFVLFMAAPMIWYLYLYQYFYPQNMPDINVFLNGTPTVGQVYDTKGKVVIELAKEYRRIVPFEKIPPHIVNAVLAAEDTRFFNPILNHGIDWIAITRAMGMNLGYTLITSIPKGKFDFVSAEGASTLTQQAVRIYFLSEITKKENNNELIYDNLITQALSSIFEIHEVNKFSRKLIEWKYSIWLEKEMARIYGSRAEAKRQIFIRFTPYLGNGRYGFDTASEYYFGKHVWELTFDETDKAALLAGIIKNPSIYTPRPNQKAEKLEIQLARRNKILTRMAEDGYITKDLSIRLREKPIEIIARNEPKTIAPSVVSDILKEVKADGFESEEIFQGKLQIKSTVDLRIQRIANQALENSLQEYEKRHPEHRGLVQGSVIVLRNKDAAILSEIGGRKSYKGREYTYSDLNRVNRQRPVGSVFKAFDYFTAYTLGRTPDDIIVDAPFSISRGYGRGSHQIHNYDGKYIGAAPLKDMLKGSRNIPAVKLVLSLGDGEESGMAKVEKVIKILGIKSSLHSDIDHKNKRLVYITSALGASEMTVIEIANGYRALATGLYAEPYMISEIANRDGNVVFTKKDSSSHLPFDSKAFEMIQYSLRRVVTQPGGTAYSLTVQKFPVPIAGKTGTTDDFRNAWFAGFTYGLNGITIVARVDFDDNRNLAPRETGSVAALPIVREIFLKIYEQNLVGPAPQFPEHIENLIYEPH